MQSSSILKWQIRKSVSSLVSALYSPNFLLIITSVNLRIFQCHLMIWCERCLVVYLSAVVFVFCMGRPFCFYLNQTNLYLLYLVENGLVYETRSHKLLSLQCLKANFCSLLAESKRNHKILCLYLSLLFIVLVVQLASG